MSDLFATDFRQSACLPGNFAMPSALGIIATLAVVTALYFGRAIFIPLALAMLLTFVLAPAVRVLRNLRFGRVASVAVVVVLTFSILIGFGALVGQQAADLADKLPQYQFNIAQKIRSFRGVMAGGGTLEQAARMLRNLRKEIGPSEPGTEQQPGAPGGGNRAGETPQPVPVVISQPEPGPLDVLERFLEPLLAPLTTTGVIIIFVVFFLMQREDLRDRLIRLAGTHDLHRTTAAINDGARRLSRYFVAQTLLNASFGLIVGLGLFLIGVPNPLLWGILAMLLRFVPYIGAFIAAAFPLALAVAVDPGWSMVLWTLALFLTVEPLVGHIIEPMVYGHSTGLSPVAVVLATMFWTWLWGPIGLLLSTPITVCLSVLGRHVDRLHFLDILFGNRPALTPEQSFYHRALARHSDEAIEQAEEFVKTRPLWAFYDEVVVQALILAQIDLMRGALDEQRLANVRETLDDLIAHLADYDDEAKPSRMAKLIGRDADATDPGEQTNGRDERLPVLTAEELAPRWRTAQPVLSIAGRGPFDEAMAAILAQLLGKHGIGARCEPNSAISSANVVRLQTEDVALACLVHIDVEISPAHLRYSNARLRRRMPDAIIVACLLAHDRKLARDELRADLGADLLATSFHDAISSCIEAARHEAPARASTAA